MSVQEYVSFNVFERLQRFSKISQNSKQTSLQQSMTENNIKKPSTYNLEKKAQDSSNQGSLSNQKVYNINHKYFPFKEDQTEFPQITQLLDRQQLNGDIQNKQSQRQILSTNQLIFDSNILPETKKEAPLDIQEPKKPKRQLAERNNNPSEVEYKAIQFKTNQDILPDILFGQNSYAYMNNLQEQMTGKLIQNKELQEICINKQSQPKFQKQESKSKIALQSKSHRQQNQNISHERIDLSLASRLKEKVMPENHKKDQSPETQTRSVSQNSVKNLQSFKSQEKLLFDFQQDSKYFIDNANKVIQKLKNCDALLNPQSPKGFNSKIQIQNKTQQEKSKEDLGVKPKTQWGNKIDMFNKKTHTQNLLYSFQKYNAFSMIIPETDFSQTVSQMTQMFRKEESVFTKGNFNILKTYKQ